jgi:hypothetical protein
MKQRKCVSCESPLPEGSEKIHIGCALYELGEITSKERDELVRREMSQAKDTPTHS